MHRSRFLLPVLAALTFTSALAGGAGKPAPLAPAVLVSPVTPARTATYAAASPFQPGSVWEGSYTCGPETAGARFTAAAWKGNVLTGRFEFFPLATGSRLPYGSVNLTGSVVADRVNLTGFQWLVQPEGYGLPTVIRYTFSNGDRQFNVTFPGSDAQATGCKDGVLRKR